MTGSEFFRVRAPQIAHETIDGEVVIINLDTGSYYSLTGAGAVAWGAIADGGSLDDVTHAVAQRYAGAGDEMRPALSTLVQALATEGLLVADSAARDGSPRADVPPPSNDLPAFVAPTLQKYTDMQDLLLLDPIHEVADTGWPHKE